MPRQRVRLAYLLGAVGLGMLERITRSVEHSFPCLESFGLVNGFTFVTRLGYDESGPKTDIPLRGARW